MSKIILKNSSVADKIPLTGDLSAGELAINTTDEKMYIKNNGGDIIDITAKGVDLGEYTIANLPDATTNSNAWALATDASGGRTIVYSDGTNWKIVSVEGATVASGGLDSNLLFHSNTTNGSTTFVDSSSYGHIMTNVGLQHSTAESKFGTSSINLNNSNNYLTIADSDDLHIGAGDFTVDFWLNIGDTITNAFKYFLMQELADNGWGFYYDTRTIVGASKGMRGYWKNAGVVTSWNWQDDASFSIDTWYHYAVTRSGNTYYMFRDGVLLNTVTDAEPFPNIAAPIRVNGHVSVASLGLSSSYLDEIRIIKGTAVWTSNFTPPTVAYTS